jgi:hypothetical protein
MTVGKDEAVTLIPLRVGWIMTQYAKVERCKDICQTKGACCVATSGHTHHIEYTAPDVGGTLFNAYNIEF